VALVAAISPKLREVRPLSRVLVAGLSVLHARMNHFMDYDRWGWLLIALGLIGLGVTVAMVVKMPA
jgi:hypothetical protein